MPVGTPTGRGSGQKVKLVIAPTSSDNLKPRFRVLSTKGKPIKVSRGDS